MKIKMLAVAAISMASAGCITTPGSLQESNADWMDVEVARPFPEVYAGLQQYARVCGGLVRGSVPQWYPALDGRSARIDMLLPGLFGPSGEAYGSIDLAQSGEGVAGRVGVQRLYSRPVFGKSEGWKDDVTKMFADIEAGSEPSC